MRPVELDQANVLRSQTITRAPPRSGPGFLARLVVLVLATSADPEAAMSAIRDAAHGVPEVARRCRQGL